MKKVILFMMIGAFALLFSTNLKADMGPKPTANIEIVGMDEDYTLDILIPIDRDVSPLDAETFDEQAENNHYLGTEYPDTLNGYQDSEGYASGVLYSGPPFTLKNEAEDTFEIGYFQAPKNFKVILFNDQGHHRK